MPLPLADGFLVSARLVAELAARPEVAAQWDDESACVGMTVGGLANHLVAQVGIAVSILGGSPSELTPITVADHYRRAAWVHTDLDEEANTSVRDDANEEAHGGPEALATRMKDALSGLPAALAAADGRQPDSWLIPWQGWALTAHGITVTRSMEMVVHSDDLAASIGVPTPEFPESVITEVLGLLTGVATRRHGQVAVVRALSRPQRAPSSVSAF